MLVNRSQEHMLLGRHLILWPGGFFITSVPSLKANDDYLFI